MNKKQRFTVLKIIIFTCISAVFFCEFSYAQFSNIKNDAFWDTKDGKPIYSQGGGIFKFPHPKTGEVKYFWYGVHYKQAEMYRENPSITQPRNNFEGVSCYSSTDLVNWEFEANVLTPDEVFKESGGRRWGWLGRMGVAYVKEANQYVLIIQYNASVLFAVADSPLGPLKNIMLKVWRVGLVRQTLEIRQLLPTKTAVNHIWFTAMEEVDTKSTFQKSD